jgi:hypothetical protein
MADSLVASARSGPGSGVGNTGSDMDGAGVYAAKSFASCSTR